MDACLEEIAGGVMPEECLVRYPDYAAQLEPLLRTAGALEYGRDVRPSPLFKARARMELTRHMQAHPRPRFSPVRIISSPVWRIAVSLTLLVMALVISGTAYAQSSMPGDTFYGWKISSERAWRALSRDRVGIDLRLADRRVHEYMLVSGDPRLSNRALQGYGEVLFRLKAETDNQTRGRILPILQSHAQSLKDSGIILPDLDEFLGGQASQMNTDAPAAQDVGGSQNNSPAQEGSGPGAKATPQARPPVSP
ncbi:MAG: hypothetical protein ACM3QS_15210 [Bacteroidota bacterium]